MKVQVAQQTKGSANPKLSDTMDCYDTIIRYLMIVTLLNELSYRQDKRMDELNLFIDYHTKYIVLII